MIFALILVLSEYDHNEQVFLFYKPTKYPSYLTLFLFNIFYTCVVDSSLEAFVWNMLNIEEDRLVNNLFFAAHELKWSLMCRSSETLTTSWLPNHLRSLWWIVQNHGRIFIV